MAKFCHTLSVNLKWIWPTNWSQHRLGLRHENRLYQGLLVTRVYDLNNCMRKMLKSVFSACVFRSGWDMEQRSIAEHYCLRELCVTTTGATGDLVVGLLSGYVSQPYYITYNEICQQVCITTAG